MPIDFDMNTALLVLGLKTYNQEVLEMNLRDMGNKLAALTVENDNLKDQLWKAQAQLGAMQLERNVSE